MIRRRAENSYLLITQGAYAAAAASLTPHLGGETFAPSIHGQQLASAVALAESGFVPVDDRPVLSPTGRPMHFAELPPATLIDIWTQSAVNAESVGACEGFLVSLQTLQRSVTLGKTAQSLRDIFSINKTEHLEIERLERLRPQLGMRNDIPMRYGIPASGIDLLPAEGQLLYDYYLMVLLQQITIEIAQHQLVFGSIGNFPTSTQGNHTQIKFRWTDTEHLNLSPWPFVPSPITLAIPALKIPHRVYDHEEELFEACTDGIPTGINTILSEAVV